MHALKRLLVLGVVATTVVALASLVSPGVAGASGTIVFQDTFANGSMWAESHAVTYGDYVGWDLDSSKYTSAPYSVGHVGYAGNEMSEVQTVNWIDLRTASSATLRFKTWYELGTNASLTVIIQTDQLDPTWGYITEQPASFTGSTGGGFTEKVIDLSAFIGHQIKLSYLLSSGSTVESWYHTNGGARVDDVSIWRDGTGASITPAAGSASGGLSVGNPRAPSTMSRSRYYTVYGYLKPRHAAGSYPVRIYRWRKESGKWKSYGYLKARASNYSTYSKYSRSVRLPYAGTWRLRAYAPADTKHPAKWSSWYDFVTVK